MLDIFWVLVVPLAFGIILTVLRAIASQTPITYETSVDVALDTTLLALGAAGGAFYNTRVQEYMGSNATVILVGYIICFLGIASYLLYIRRYAKSTTLQQARVNISLGILACALDAVVIYLGT